MESALDPIELAALLSALEHVLGRRGIDVCGTEWGKQLGDGLFEFRIRHTAEETASMFGGQRLQGTKVKILLRVFCHAYGDRIVLLLNGYDKGDDPSEKRQQREIKLARQRLRRFKERRNKKQR